MIQVFIISLVLVAIAFLALGVNIFFAKKPFPETEVGKNKKMKELGIECTKCGEMRRYKEKKKYMNLSLDSSRLQL
jgi:hypothetical protein